MAMSSVRLGANGGAKQFSRNALHCAMAMALSTAMAGSAHAAKIYAGSDYDVYTVPDEIQKDLIEVKTYVNQREVAKGEKLTGSLEQNVARDDVYWVSTDAYGLDGVGDGFATIKGGKFDGKNTLIHDITFGVFNSGFDDVEFSIIPENQQDIDFTITATFWSGDSETSAYSTANGLTDLLVLSQGKLFKEINIQSESGVYISGSDRGETTDGGATQTKQWLVSGIVSCENRDQFCQPRVQNEVPLPAAAWLFGSGLLGLAGVARRRSSAKG